MVNPKETPKAPAVTDEMIAWLDRLFPNRAPELDTPDRHVWFAAGQANVVARLKAEQARQRSGAT